MYGMHTGQQDRHQQFKAWLNCHEVDCFGQPIIEPEPTEPDLQLAHQQLAALEQMFAQGVQVAQVKLDPLTAAYVHEQLPPHYRHRVLFV